MTVTPLEINDVISVRDTVRANHKLRASMTCRMLFPEGRGWEWEGRGWEWEGRGLEWEGGVGGSERECEVGGGSGRVGGWSGWVVVGGSKRECEVGGGSGSKSRPGASGCPETRSTSMMTSIRQHFGVHNASSKGDDDKAETRACDATIASESAFVVTHDEQNQVPLGISLPPI